MFEAVIILSKGGAGIVRGVDKDAFDLLEIAGFKCLQGEQIVTPDQDIVEEVTFALATVGWGWHINTATHVLRLILGGVFDRHPRLQIIIGHMGEGTSFMLPRFDATLKPELTGLQHPVSTYLRQNLHYTFANFNDEATYANLVAQVGIGRVAFSADYPFGSMRTARDFLDKLPLSDDERAAISHRNAEQLLGV